MEVSHEEIRSSIAVLHAKSDARDREIVALRSDVSAIKGQLGNGSNTFATMRQNITSLTEAISKLDVTVTKLVAAENQRIGREGVWSAIVRSPVFGWLVAAGTAVAGFFAWMGKGS